MAPKVRAEWSVATAMALASLVAFSAPSVTAQSPDAPHPSADVKVLYAHHHDSDTEEMAGWMNTLADDPTANDIALGTGDPVTAAASVTYTLTLNPALAADVELDGDGMVKVTAYIGASMGSGVTMVSTEIKSGDQVVATGAEKNHVIQPSQTATYAAVTWEVAPAITTLPAGAPLVWTVTIEGTATGAFLGVHPDRGRSNVELPIVSGGGGPPPAGGRVVHGNLTGTKAEVSLSFENATDDEYRYNWTSAHSRVKVSYDASVDAGAIELAIIDAEEKIVFEATINATGDESATVADLSPGDWTITLAFSDFQGSVGLVVEAAGDGGTTTTTSTQTSGTTTETGATTTTTPTESKKGGIPTAGLGLSVLALVAAVVVARRRS